MDEQAQLRALIDTAVDGILSISADGRLRLYNKASERIFGYKEQEVLGQTIEKLMPPSYSEHHQEFIDSYLAGGAPKIIGAGRQVEGLRRDGSVFPMHLSVGEFREEGERYFVGIVRDLSEEIAAREHNQMLQEQLEMISRYSAVNEMGAALAHELNQPLTAIELFLAAADRQLEKDPVALREIFLRVREEAGRAGNIVRRIREMVERTDGERTVFRLNEVIESAADLCRLVDRKGQSIRLGSVTETDVFGDPTQIRMILVNLIKNALDATDGMADRQVLIHLTVKDRILIDVIDNGPGVSPEFVGALFEPFLTTKEKGLGIGLSICRTIAEGHGGKLTYRRADPHADKLPGAVFTLELPRLKEAESA
ncbi:MAG: PAS domain S-box protein [Pseudomonadota bacterium]